MRAVSSICRVAAFFLLAVLMLLPAGANALQLSNGKPGPGAGTLKGMGADPADWPMFGHDPQHTSYNPAEHTINAGNVNQLPLRWQAPLPTGAIEASSAPSIANGKVYVGSSVANGNNFFAFDASTGAPAWSAYVGFMSGCFGVGVGSTAAISGTVVSVGGGDAAYYGLDASTGAILWRNPINAGPSSFAWVSPLMAYGRSYVGVSSDCDDPSVRGELRALDMFSGTQQANVYFVPDGQTGAGIWQSPALSPDGSMLVIDTGEDQPGSDGPYTRAMVSLDPNTLQILQANKQGAPGLDNDWGSSPLIFSDSQGRVLVGANQKSGTFYTYVLNDINSGPIWSQEAGSVDMLGAYDPTYGNGGTLFFARNNSIIYAVDPATGATRWTPVTLDVMWGNMAVANGLIYLNVNGSLVILDELTGATLRTITPPHAGGAFSGPSIAHGLVYWQSGGYLNAYGLVPPTTPSATPTVCSLNFTDVTQSDPFYAYVRCLACQGIVSGYDDGTFRPGNNVTRAQVTKIIAASAGYNNPIPPGQQTFEDVPPADTFWLYVERSALHGIITGYACGQAPAGPCVPPDNRPYFLPYASMTRGQVGKVDSEAVGYDDQIPADRWTFQDVPPGSTFWLYVERTYLHGAVNGYACGSPPAGPCVPPYAKPYFLPSGEISRGQASKVVSNSFFPGCDVRR